MIAARMPRLLATLAAMVALTAPAHGQTPNWLGWIEVHPIHHDFTAYLRLSGVWIDTCVPDLLEAKIEPGRIDLLLDIPALNVGCGDAPTPWEIDQRVGPLTPWTTYDIYGTVELVDPNDRQERRHDTGPDLLVESYSADLSGDFDMDGQVRGADADLLAEARMEGGPLDPFDLNLDGVIDTQDHLFWIWDLSGLVVGDSDENGRFDSSDLVLVFQAAQYEDDVPLNSIWSTGDWDGDGEFSSVDFVFAFTYSCYEGDCCRDWCGPRPAQLAVPEPNGAMVALLGLLLLPGHLRRRIEHRKISSE